MNKNLFVVESPLQLLSALEAKDYFKEYYSILLLKYSGESNRKNDLLLEKIINEFSNFDEVIQIQPSNGSLEANFRLLVELKRLQLKQTLFSKIFIGEYRSWYHRKFFSFLRSEEIFLLDDGNITIELQKNYIPTGKYYASYTHLKGKENIRRLKNIINLFFYKAISLIFYNRNYEANKDIHLFTCFDLDPYNQHQKIIENSFSYVKKNSKKNKVDKSEIYFFGANFSELNLLNRDVEFLLLEKIIRYFRSKNKKLVYIPHRREDTEKLELIQDKFNIDIYAFSYPAEIQFLFLDVHPEGIASFISTALFTVSKMFDFNSVDAFLLPIEQIPSIIRQNYISVYNEYQKTMNVIDLNELS